MRHRAAAFGGAEVRGGGENGPISRRVRTVLGAYLAGHMTPAPKLSRGLADGTARALASKGGFKSGASPLKKLQPIYFPGRRPGHHFFVNS